MMGVAGQAEREVAAKVCTEKEFEAWQLRDRGLSRWAISLALGIGLSSVRDRLRNADRKIAIELGKETAA
jgi:DNA-binding CsgD family transcriptional regulator